MVGARPLLFEQECFGVQGCHSCSSFWWTYLSTKILHLKRNFPLRQHAPSSKSTQIHYLLAQPSAPQAARQKQKHDPAVGMDLCLTFLGPCHFWGENKSSFLLHSQWADGKARPQLAWARISKLLTIRLWGQGNACSSFAGNVLNVYLVPPANTVLLFHIYIALAFLMTYGSHDPWLRRNANASASFRAWGPEHIFHFLCPIPFLSLHRQKKRCSHESRCVFSAYLHLRIITNKFPFGEKLPFGRLFYKWASLLLIVHFSKKWAPFPVQWAFFPVQSQEMGVFFWSGCFFLKNEGRN